MASNCTNPSDTPDLTRSRSVIVAIAASVVQMLMMIPGYSEDESFQFGEWLVVLAISWRCSALRSSCSPFPGVASLRASCWGRLALVSVLVFWAGITLPLAAAAAAVAWRLRRGGNTAAVPGRGARAGCGGHRGARRDHHRRRCLQLIPRESPERLTARTRR